MSKQFLGNKVNLCLIIRWLGTPPAPGTMPAATRPCSARTDTPASSNAEGIWAVTASASKATGSAVTTNTFSVQFMGTDSEKQSENQYFIFVRDLENTF